MKVLFLDVDGVLNGHEWDESVMSGQIHREKVQRLNRVLRATGAKVVLSSAWRYLVYRGDSNLMGLEWLFRSHGMLADRLIGITRPDTMERERYLGDPATWPVVNERGQQVSDWLRESGNSVVSYAVIDDLDLGIRDAGHPFVQTDGQVGITDANADELIELLAGTSV